MTQPLTNVEVTKCQNGEVKLRMAGVTVRMSRAQAVELAGMLEREQPEALTKGERCVVAALWVAIFTMLFVSWWAHQ